MSNFAGNGPRRDTPAARAREFWQQKDAQAEQAQHPQTQQAGRAEQPANTRAKKPSPKIPEKTRSELGEDHASKFSNRRQLWENIGAKSQANPTSPHQALAPPANPPSAARGSIRNSMMRPAVDSRTSSASTNATDENTFKRHDSTSSANTSLGDESTFKRHDSISSANTSLVDDSTFKRHDSTSIEKNNSITHTSQPPHSQTDGASSSAPVNSLPPSMPNNFAATLYNKLGAKERLGPNEVYNFHRPLQNQAIRIGNLSPFLPHISERRSELGAMEATWQGISTRERQRGTSDTQAAYTTFDQAIQAGATLAAHAGGLGGAYFLKDPSGQPLFVIKPLDEDILGINNRKGNVYLGPDQGPRTRSRDGIPLNTSVQREVAASRVAERAGLGHCIPTTIACFVNAENLAQNGGDKFADFTDGFSDAQLGGISRGGQIKLCSVQKFVPGAGGFGDLENDLVDDFAKIKSWEQEPFLAKLINQKSFEETNILMWVLGETDGHFGNFCCEVIRADGSGDESPISYKSFLDLPTHAEFNSKGEKTKSGKEDFQIRFVKIDSGLALPEKEGELRNTLVVLPNAQLPLSDNARKLILSIDEKEISQCIEESGLPPTAAVAATARIRALKEISSSITNSSIEDINYRILSLGVPGLEHIATQTTPISAEQKETLRQSSVWGSDT